MAAASDAEDSDPVIVHQPRSAKHKSELLVGSDPNLCAKPAKKKLWPGLKEIYPQLPAEKVDYEELQQRLLVTIALEAARVMEEGIVTDPREADVGSILAFGFAPYTGGALSYIDGIGAKRFVKIAKGLQKKYGAEFKAPKLLLDMAEKGETFYERFDPYAKGDVKQAA